MIEIPVNYRAARQRMSVIIDGVRYAIKAAWNGRHEAWFLTVANDAGADIVTAVKAVVGTLVFEQFADRAIMPPGRFFVMDTESGADRIGRYNFGAGRRFRLLYAEGAELEVES